MAYQSIQLDQELFVSDIYTIHYYEYRNDFHFDGDRCAFGVVQRAVLQQAFVAQRPAEEGFIFCRFVGVQLEFRTRRNGDRGVAQHSAADDVESIQRVVQHHVAVGHLEADSLFVIRAVRVAAGGEPADVPAVDVGNVGVGCDGDNGALIGVKVPFGAGGQMERTIQHTRFGVIHFPNVSNV